MAILAILILLLLVYKLIIIFTLSLCPSNFSKTCRKILWNLNPSLLGFVYIHSFRFLLILSGSVERNPGPPRASKNMNGRIRFAHWNVNSLLARNGDKIRQIEALQSVEKFDVFGLSETWLNDSVPTNDVSIEGFSKPFRSDCPEANDHPRGGVCLYFMNHIPIIQRKDLQIINECIVAEIKLARNKKIFLILVYRSPSQSTETLNKFGENLTELLAKVNNENPSLVIFTGDFNARSPLLWSGEHTENAAGKLIADFSNLNCFEQLIDEPTHLPRDNIETCIDLILASNSTVFVDTGVIPSLDSCCKHNIIFGKVNFHVPPPPKYNRIIWEYNKCNTPGLRDEVKKNDWLGIFLGRSVEEMVDIFTKTFTNIAKKYIPSKIITISDKDAPWITPPVKSAVKRNKRAYRKWVSGGRKHEEKNRVNTVQNETNSIIKEAKIRYINDLSAKLCDPNTGSKVFWSAYKKLLNNRKNTNIPPLMVNGNFISKFKEKAEIFNNYFAEQCQPFVNSSILPPTPNSPNGIKLTDIDITESSISQIINKLNPKKAHGWDGISIQLLKTCPDEISLPLKLIFTKSFQTGLYPDIWKKANVQPVHKKDSRQDIKNYRPISLLPICGKIFEKIILFDSLYVFLTSNSLLSKNQSGFRPGDSAINQLLSITTEIYECFEEYDEVRAVFLDLSKAFDKVWHKGLTFKLKRCGINGPFLHILENYLSNRKQRVVLNGQESEWVDINSGVPQGSVVGPLLFLIYINDLTDNISSNVRLFADDVSLFTRVKDVTLTHEQLIQDLKVISDWAYQWKMKFNPDITKQAIEVIFSTKYKKANHPLLDFNDIPVARKDSTKHLGVVLDEKLTFREHIKEAITKAKKGIALMKYLSKYVTAHVLEMTYKMYVRPHLEYGDIIYHDQQSDMMNHLESIQYQAGLIITKCWKGTNRQKLYKELGWESLSQRRIFRRLSTYYSILNDKTPLYLKEHIKPIKTNMTNRFSKTFFPFCNKGWDDLSENLKSAISLPAFKKLYINEFVPPKIGYFTICDKFGIRLLTKLRVDFSDLRAHRFNHRLNCNSPLCKCLTDDETVEHFFVRCPLFHSQRKVLLESLNDILKNDISALPDDHITKLLLYGSTSFNLITNKLILEASIRYIKKTRRFTKLEAFKKNNPTLIQL